MFQKLRLHKILIPDRRVLLKKGKNITIYILGKKEEKGKIPKGLERQKLWSVEL